MSSASTFSSTWQWLTDVLFTGHRFAHGEIADEEESALRLEGDQVIRGQR